jgi:hypothetical protein
VLLALPSDPLLDPSEQLLGPGPLWLLIDCLVLGCWGWTPCQACSMAWGCWREVMLLCLMLLTLFLRKQGS